MEDDRTPIKEPPTPMISQNSTFGECLDSGYQITVHCGAYSCNNAKKLPLEAMAAKYGRNHGALHADLIKLPWKCEKCGGREVSFRYQPGCMQYRWFGTRGEKRDDDCRSEARNV